MAKWEYLNFGRVGGAWTDDRYDGRTPQDKLTDYGQEGWELVSVCYDNSGYNYFLKRAVTASKRTTKKPATKTTKK